ncbi:hypothetical protein CUU95_15585 [Vreelandella alkaliphila]|uniref:hypothetical protein n=1 Tax=Vreelandella alkaliphila TaxID=272774 RepID=UPI000EA10ADD|nr:hypothetical protein [Halomonas alkaliphila]AYF35154.1 hypothetical protein CUU95_15585 [Halomonas alkaliphila]
MIKPVSLVVALLLSSPAFAESMETLNRQYCQIVKGVTMKAFQDRAEGVPRVEVLIELDTPILRQAAREAYDAELPEDEEEATKLREGVARVVEFECLVDRGVL